MQGRILYSNLIRPEIQRFIDEHLKSDINDLILKYPDILGVPIRDIVTQIQAKKKAKEKIPSWYNTKGLIYPSPLSMEQSSSDKTGNYKSTLFSGQKALDLTGGAGVDTYYLSKSFSKVEYIEKDKLLVELADHNFPLLKVSNVNYHCSSAEDFVKKLKSDVDLIYLDPSRRHKGNKIFKLSECSPDVTSIQKTLLERSKHVLIKTSPLLDIHKTVNDLNNVIEVIILSVRNEVREVLYHLSRTSVNEPLIRAVNIPSNRATQIFKFLPSQEKESSSRYSSPVDSAYLYEANSAILKAGAFKIIGNKWDLNKLHPNTHLYTSNKLYTDFPGRVFQVDKIFTSISNSRKILSGKKLNIITRNYPLKPQELGDKIKTLDGGKKYLIAAIHDKDKKGLFYCSRIV